MPYWFQKGDIDPSRASALSIISNGIRTIGRQDYWATFASHQAAFIIDISKVAQIVQYTWRFINQIIIIVIIIKDVSTVA